MARQQFPPPVQLIGETSRRYPDNVAVKDCGEILTYRQLILRSSSLARHLQGCGAKPSMIIPIITNSCVNMIIGVLGILKAGATYVPIDRDQWAQERIQHVLRRTSAGLVVCTGTTIEFPNTKVINIDELDLDATLTKDFIISDVEQAEIAAIIFTSGTTGVPKGVELTQNSVSNFVSTPCFNYDITPEDRVLLVLSIAFDACMGTLFNTLCNGGTVVLANYSNIQQESRICSVLVLTPSILAALEPPQQYGDYPYLDRIVMGGETPSVSLLRAWGVLKRPMWMAYGPTEAFCACLTGLAQTDSSSEQYLPTKFGSVLRNAQVRIIDECGNDIVDLYKNGELVVSGAGLARGYYQDEIKTKEKFIYRSGVRMYRTGDFAKWSQDGQGRRVIDFCGRRDRTTKIRGFLVNLEQDVDAEVLQMDPDIVEAHSILLKDQLFIFLSPVPRDLQDLRARWKAKVSSYLVPHEFVGLDALPMTANGKVDPKKLIEMAEGLDVHPENVKIQVDTATDIKSVVINNTAKVLGVPLSKIDISESFVSQGFHSLSAVRLSSLCRKQGFNVPIEKILIAHSIDDLIQVCDQKKTVQAHSLQSPARVEKAPLTELQKVLLYDNLHHKTHNVVQYIATYATGDLEKLHSAWRTVVQAEPIFRTELSLDAGTQRLVDEVNFHWAECSVVHCQHDVDTKRTEAATKAGLGAGLSILHCRGPEYASDENIVILSIHHALIDGFSAALLLNKVAAVLDGQAFEPSPPFTEAVDRLQKHSAQREEEARRYWERQEEKFPEAVGHLLPANRPFLPGKGHAELHLHTDLTVSTLSKYAEANGTTPAAFHYAAWALTLASYANTDTVMFGAIVSTRLLGFEDADRVIGPMISTQPMRLAIVRHDTAATLVRQVGRKLRKISKYQGTESKTQTSQYCSTLAIQYDSSVTESQTVKPLRPPVVLEQPGLPLNLLVEGDGRVRFLYRCDTFGADEVQHLATLYKNLLQSLTKADSKVLECLDQRLGKRLENLVLTHGHLGDEITRVPSDESNRENTVLGQLNRAVQENPDLIALEKDSKKVTYAELDDRAARVALVIRRMIQPGDVVCVSADRSINWITGAFAILKARGVYAPIDSSHEKSFRADLVKRSGATLFLHTHSVQMAEHLEGGPVALSIDQILESSTPRPECTKNCELPSAKDACFLCFTSGSTGKPKGVTCNHGGVTAFHSDLEVRMNSAPGVRIAQFLSPGFDGCVSEILSALCYGSTLVLRKSPDDIFSHLKDVDVAMITPSVAAELDAAEHGNLRKLYLCGEPVQQATLDKWASGRTLYNLYGPTEGTIGACQARLQAGTPANVGPPVASTRLYILDDNMKLSPPGAVGNVFIAGVQISRGYVGMPEQTKATFTVDPFCPSEMMYRTGDLGFWDADGNVHVRGRRDRQIKMRGYRVDLDDIGGLATRIMSQVRKAVATEHKGKVVLWVEPVLSDEDRQCLESKLRSTLPYYAMPKHVTTMDKLPLSRNGKVVIGPKEVALLPISSSAKTSEHVELTRWEEVVACEWRAVLGLDASAVLHPHDNFTSMGGHSVLQLGLTVRLRKACRVPLRVRDVVQAASLADMAAALQTRAEELQKVKRTPPIEMNTPKPAISKFSPAEVEWVHRYSNSSETCTFNVPWAAELKPGAVDIPRLRDALNEVMARYPILRSRYQPTSTRSISSDPVEVQLVDHIDLQNFVNKPFDLIRGPIARVELSKSLLAINISHIACDLTTLHYLLSEAATLHNGGTLPPVTNQYYNASSWYEPIDSEAAKFWSKNLEGLKLLRCPDVEDVSWRKSYRGTSEIVEIPDKLRQGIDRLTQGTNLTLHQFALATTASVLHVIGARDDVVLGSPYANRASVEDQNTVGLFLQPLPVRVKIPSSWTSSEVLAGVRHSSQDSLANFMPWHTLLKHLGLPFPSHRQQLFDCVVTFHDDRSTTKSPFPVAGAKPVHVWTEGSKFSLLCEWHAFEDRLSLRLEYDTDNISKAAIDIIRELTLLAAEKLLQPAYRYDDLLKHLKDETKQMCDQSDMTVNGLRKLAVNYLRGV